MRIYRDHLLPEYIWLWRNIILWLLTLATVLWFDVVWCAGTTFTAFSMPETWVNALLLSLVFSAPIIIGGVGWLQVVTIAVLAL